VDSDEEERRGIMEILKGAGYQVLEARDRAEALAVISDWPQALVVVAEEAPPGPAPELLVALRQATRAPIVVIGDEREVTEVGALLFGADYYDRRHAERVRRRAIQTLERRGYLGILEPAA